MTKEEVFAQTIDAFAEATLYAFCIAIGFIIAMAVFSKKDN